MKRQRNCTRRRFLIGGLQVTALAPLGWAGARRAGAPLDANGERVLVVVQLSGGNDGLNTVVPYRQDEYYRMRPTLALAPGQLHALDADHGWHPALGELARLFERGDVACVHSVGYPKPNRSHFRSLEIWHTGDPEHPAGDVGWLGRALERVAAHAPEPPSDHRGAMPALHIGGGNLPLALRSREALAPTIENHDAFRLREVSESVARGRDRLLARQGGNTDVRFLREAARASYRAAERMAELSTSPSSVSYPDQRLARELQLVAQLVAGGFGTRIFYLTLNGFDTHARQAPIQAALLRELSQSLGAFQEDLTARGLDGRVATLVFSEFGRRARENASKGTDHGAGAPVWLVGGGVRGGSYGTPPDLARLEDGDVPFGTDLRSVYSAVERDWLGLEPSAALAPLELFG